MKNKPIPAIAIASIIGIAFQAYKGDYKNAADIPTAIAVFIGSALGLVMVVTILPLLVSLIIFVKNKTFPKDLFTNMSYGILVFISILMFVGEWALKRAVN